MTLEAAIIALSTFNTPDALGKWSAALRENNKNENVEKR
jgi:hypothetical protein